MAEFPCCILLFDNFFSNMSRHSHEMIVVKLRKFGFYNIETLQTAFEISRLFIEYLAFVKKPVIIKPIHKNCSPFRIAVTAL